MEIIGQYSGRQIVYMDYNDSKLPNEDWICLAISNQNPDLKKLENFIRKSISHNILEFKAHGIFSEKLHDYFDEIVSIMEVNENHKEINVMTTWHTNETLADTFWQCFFATCLPESTNYENIKILCVDLDGTNRVEELKTYINKFEKGWIPE